MSEAKSGDTVKVHYTGRLADGTIFDSSEGRDPLEFELGSRTLIPAFEDAVVGMAAGGDVTLEIAADDAYGPRHEEAVQTVERDQIPDNIELAVGSVLQATGPGGEALTFSVVELAEATVTLDANHPLAGKDLVFDIQLIEIISG